MVVHRKSNRGKTFSHANFPGKLEGVFTILVGIIFAALMPRSTSNPVCRLGIRFFDARESHILTRRIVLDDPTKHHLHKNITWSEIRKAVSRSGCHQQEQSDLLQLANWRLYPHVIFTIAGLAPSSTMWSYAPTLVNSFGYARLRSNALVSIGQWIQLIINIAWGFTAFVYLSCCLLRNG